MAEPMLIVGLGNPGAKYALTRHNIGFMVVDLLANRWGVDRFHEKFHGLLGETTRGGQKIYLLKPQTFMNRSGLSVADCARFYKVPEASLVVLVDEIDIPAGALRLRKDGGAGGHNGMKSIIDSLGHQNFPRLRLGVGRSSTMDAADHVLSQIPKAEWALYEELVARGADAVEMVVESGLDRAMNTFNQKKDDKP